MNEIEKEIKIKICPICKSERKLERDHKEGTLWLCPECQNYIEIKETVEIVYNHDKSQDLFKELDINKLPSIIAIPLRDYLNEDYPALRIIYLCHAIEMITKFLTIAGFAELRSLLHEKVPENVLKEFQHSIRCPAFGHWKGLINITSKALKNVENYESILDPIIKNLNKVLDVDNAELLKRGILTLRNNLAHGNLTKSKSTELLDYYEKKLSKLWPKLKTLEETALVHIGKEYGQIIGPTHVLEKYTPPQDLVKKLESHSGHIVMIRKNKILELWPICLYDVMEGVQYETDNEIPSEKSLIYDKTDKKGLVYRASGVSGKYDMRDEEVIASFRNLFELDKPLAYDYEEELSQDYGEFRGKNRILQVEKAKTTIEKSLEKAGEPDRITKDNVFWITGVAGIGKTMVMTKLAQDFKQDFEKKDDHLRIAYRFTYGDDRCSRENFLRYAIINIANWLKMEIPDIETSKNLLIQFQYILDQVESSKTPRFLLIFLDGLDEIYPIDPAFIDLPFTMHKKNVLWICAGRSEQVLRQKFSENQCTHLFGPEGLGKMEKEDIRGWLFFELEQGELQKLKLRDVEVDGEIAGNAFINEIEEKAEGLPLYVHFVIDEIKDKEIDISDVDKLPRGLGGYYEKLLSKGGILDQTSILAPLAVTVAWAEEPLIKQSLYYFLTRRNVLPDDKDSQKLLNDVINSLKTILTPSIRSDGTTGYTLFHPTLRKHIHTSHLLDRNNILAHKEFINSINQWQEIEDKNSRNYIIQYAVHHLIKAKEYSSKPNPGYRFFKNLEEERETVRATTECLIEFLGFNQSLARHIDKFEIISKWLVDDFKEYILMIELADAAEKPLEYWSYWPVYNRVMEFGLKAAKVLQGDQFGYSRFKTIQYQLALSRGIFHSGNYDRAMQHGQKALKMADELGFSELEAEILQHIGSLYRFKGKREQALEHIKKAEDILEETDDLATRAKCYYSRALVEHSIESEEQIQKARELYDKALEIGRKEDEQGKPIMGERIFDLLRVRGDLGYYEKDYDLARESWELLKKYAEEMNSEHNILIATSRLTLIDEELDLGNMKDSWMKILNTKKLSGEVAATITSYGELAEVYICIGGKNNLDEAIRLCKEGEKLIKEVDNLHTQSGYFYVKGLRLLAEGDRKAAEVELERSESKFGEWSPYRYWVRDTLERLDRCIDITN